jgi:hypothetical protein
LTLLDYVLHAGSENVVIYFRDNIYIIKTLKEFVYVDEDGQDVGANVRQKAKDITNLLMDEDRLRMERKSRGAMRERMLGNIAESGLRGEDDYGDRQGGGREERFERPKETYKPNKGRDEDDDLKRAIEESKRAAQDDESRARARNQECVERFLTESVLPFPALIRDGHLFIFTLVETMTSGKPSPCRKKKNPNDVDNWKIQTPRHCSTTICKCA